MTLNHHTKAILLPLLLLLIILQLGKGEDIVKPVYTEKCTLTGIPPVNPFPNLKKCYKFNTDSCCNIMHDTIISDFTSEIIIDPCLRKYPELEEILCFGCHPLEQSFIDEANKKLYICEDFAMKIWNAKTPEDLDKPSTRYDNCGLMIPEYDNPGYGLDEFSDGKNYILPSVIPTFLRFINAMKIPLYEDYDIEVMQGNDKTKCYTSQGLHYHSLPLLMYIILMFLFLNH